MLLTSSLLYRNKHSHHIPWGSIFSKSMLCHFDKCSLHDNHKVVVILFSIIYEADNHWKYKVFWNRTAYIQTHIYIYTYIQYTYAIYICNIYYLCWICNKLWIYCIYWFISQMSVTAGDVPGAWNYNQVSHIGGKSPSTWARIFCLLHLHLQEIGLEVK